MKQPKLLIALFVILAIDAMNFGIVIPVLPKLFLGDGAVLVSQSTSLATRYTLMGLVLGVYPLAVCIGTPVLGILSDRLGRKPILFLSLLGTFFALCFSSLALVATNVTLLLIARVLTGLCSASQPIAQAAVADLSHQENRPFYFSLVAFSMTIGMLIGPLLGGFLSDDKLWSGLSVATPFYVAALLAFANMLFMLCFYRETLPVVQHKLSSLKQYTIVCMANFKKIRFVTLLIVFILLEMAWSLFFQTQPILLAKLYSYTSEQQSLYITFLGGVMCFGLIALFKPLSKLMSLPKLTFYCLIVNALGYVSLCIFRNEISAWLLTVAVTLGVGLGYTAVVSQLSLLVPAPLQGWLMGFTSALLALAWAISGLFGPKLLQHSAVLPVLICFILIAAALPFVGREKKAALNLNDVSHG